MRSVRLAIAAGFVLAVVGAAAAADEAGKETPPAPMPPAAPQQAEPQKEAMPQASGRFSFVRVDGGVLRLDSASGQVSFCSQRTVGWACAVVPEERAALAAEIERLQGEVASLKDEIAKAQPPRPPADISPQPGNGEAKLQFPSREEMERARAALERAWRHLVEIISEFQKDLMKKG